MKRISNSLVAYSWNTTLLHWAPRPSLHLCLFVFLSLPWHRSPARHWGIKPARMIYKKLLSNCLCFQSQTASTEAKQIPLPELWGLLLHPAVELLPCKFFSLFHLFFDSAQILLETFMQTCKREVPQNREPPSFWNFSVLTLLSCSHTHTRPEIAQPPKFSSHHVSPSALSSPHTHTLPSYKVDLLETSTPLLNRDAGKFVRYALCKNQDMLGITQILTLEHTCWLTLLASSCVCKSPRQ